MCMKGNTGNVNETTSLEYPGNFILFKIVKTAFNTNNADPLKLPSPIP